MPVSVSGSSRRLRAPHRAQLIRVLAVALLALAAPAGVAKPPAPRVSVTIDRTAADATSR